MTQKEEWLVTSTSPTMLWDSFYSRHSSRQTHTVVESIKRVLHAGRPGLKSSKLCDSRQALSLFPPHFPHPSMETVRVPTIQGCEEI